MQSARPGAGDEIFPMAASPLLPHFGLILPHGHRLDDGAEYGRASQRKRARLRLRRAVKDEYCYRSPRPTVGASSPLNPKGPRVPHFAMKTLCRLHCVLLLLIPTVQAQEAMTGPAAGAVAPMPTPAQLDHLLGPIALYPDALIGLILPAATAPADIVLASRQVQAPEGAFTPIESQRWDDSVKSLARYPEVLKWMDENLTWTKQVGEAFISHPADVLKSVQRLRAKAHGTGALASTPQQQVLAESDAIRIIPAQPDVIYVPYYHPHVVFAERTERSWGPSVSFSVGYPVGSWLAYECDWQQRSVWVGDRHRTWQGHDWRRPMFSNRPTNMSQARARRWQPTKRSSRSAPSFASYQPIAATVGSDGAYSRPLINLDALAHERSRVGLVSPPSSRPRSPVPSAVAPRTTSGLRPSTSDFARHGTKPPVVHATGATVFNRLPSRTNYVRHHSSTTRIRHRPHRPAALPPAQIAPALPLTAPPLAAARLAARQAEASQSRPRPTPANTASWQTRASRCATSPFQDFGAPTARERIRYGDLRGRGHGRPSHHDRGRR